MSCSHQEPYDLSCSNSAAWASMLALLVTLMSASHILFDSSHCTHLATEERHNLKASICPSIRDQWHTCTRALRLHWPSVQILAPLLTPLLQVPTVAVSSFKLPLHFLWPCTCIKFAHKIQRHQDCTGVLLCDSLVNAHLLLLLLLLEDLSGCLEGCSSGVLVLLCRLLSLCTHPMIILAAVYVRALADLHDQVAEQCSQCMEVRAAKAMHCS